MRDVKQCVPTLLRCCVMMAGLCACLASCEGGTATDEPVRPVEKRSILFLTADGTIYSQDHEQVTQLPYCTYASQIIKDGDDYFVSGTYEKEGTDARVGYWKNGKWNTLHVDFIEDVDHWIYGIGKWDSYIYLLDYPNVLKNSGIFPLEDGELFIPAFQALAVSNGHCYVVGSKRPDESSGNYMPVLYTEHKGKYTAEELPVPQGTTEGECTCVYAYGGTHSLIGGFADRRPVIWVDKQLQVLPLTAPVAEGSQAASNRGAVRSLTECGGAVYAAGMESVGNKNAVATVWCEDAILHLETDPDSVYASEVVEIKSYGTDIYVATLEYHLGAVGEMAISTVLWMNNRVIQVYPGLLTKSFTVM